MFSWLHSYVPSPILVDFGIIQIHWYGLLMLFSILVAFFVLYKKAEIFSLTREQVWDLLFWLVIGGLLGARIYEVLLVEPSFYFSHPVQIVKVWQGGLAIHGAWLGGLIVLWLYSRKWKIALGKLTDAIAFVLPLGQAIGRWGNYFNQELYGLPTNLPWGIPINPINRLVEYSSFNYFHPTYLYESIGNFFIFFILLWLIGKKRFVGQITLVYLGLYSLLRLILEFIRLDPALMIYGLRWPIIFSLLSILLVIILYFKLYLQHAKS